MGSIAFLAFSNTLYKHGIPCNMEKYINMIVQITNVLFCENDHFISSMVTCCWFTWYTIPEGLYVCQYEVAWLQELSLLVF